MAWPALLSEINNLSKYEYYKKQLKMDLFHKLIDLVDKNAERLPEGDYVEICNIIKDIREKVKPPHFLVNQMSTEEEEYPGLNQFLQELHEEWYRTDDGDEEEDETLSSEEAIEQLREHIEQYGVPERLTINFVQ